MHWLPRTSTIPDLLTRDAESIFYQPDKHHASANIGSNSLKHIIGFTFAIFSSEYLIKMSYELKYIPAVKR